MKEKNTHMMPLHNLRQSVWFIIGGKRGKVHFLLLQSLIIQPQSKYTKQPVGNQSAETKDCLRHWASTTSRTTCRTIFLVYYSSATYLTNSVCS